MCVRGKKHRFGEGGEAPLISGLVGLRGSGRVLRLRGVLGESFGTSQSMISKISKSTVHHCKCLDHDKHISARFPL